MRFALIWILPKASLFLQNTEIKAKQKHPLRGFLTPETSLKNVNSWEQPRGPLSLPCPALPFPSCRFLQALPSLECECRVRQSLSGKKSLTQSSGGWLVQEHLLRPSWRHLLHLFLTVHGQLRQAWVQQLGSSQNLHHDRTNNPIKRPKTWVWHH